MGANWTLGLAVLSVGLVYQAVAQAIDESNSSPPAWPRVISIVIWGLLAGTTGHVTNVLYKSGYDLTILLIVCAAAVTVGCVAGRLLDRVGEMHVARRGERTFRHVMAERERGKNEDGK